MSFEKAERYLKEKGLASHIIVPEASTATVELAAEALGTELAAIAKTLSFHVDGRVALVLFAGDARINNRKFKDQFHTKAKMLSADEAEQLIGHGVGGVCPFGVNDCCDVYLDESLRRFDVVYPAAGTAASAVRLTPAELERVCAPCQWIDVSKLPE